MTKEQFLERCGWIADGVCLYNMGSPTHPNWVPCESIDIRGNVDFYCCKLQPKHMYKCTIIFLALGHKRIITLFADNKRELKEALKQRFGSEIKITNIKRFPSPTPEQRLARTK